ncbi:MAG: ferredoxin family protein [Candidatus Sericytochromatia bacterium]
MAKYVSVNAEKCKGCWLCVDSCPSNLFRVSSNKNNKGYNVIEMVDQKFCSGNDCLKCIDICPDNAFIKPSEDPDKISSTFYWLGKKLTQNVLDRKNLR